MVAKTTKSKIKSKTSKTKKSELFLYSCVHRQYILTIPETKERKYKTMWIVIGKGHKRYRKFETQKEAIEYFRKLKKHAKMIVQSSKSNDFIKTVYTLSWIEAKGVDIKSIKPKTTKEEYEFEDAFSEFDEVEDTYEEIDHEEINKIIEENEGIVLVDENFEQLDIVEEKEEIIDYEMVNHEKSIIINPKNIEYLVFELIETKEVVVDEEAKNSGTNKSLLINEKNDLFYEKSKDQQPTKEVNQIQNIEEKQEKNEQQAILQINNIEQQEEALILKDEIQDENKQAIKLEEEKSKSSIIYWFVVGLICLALASIIVVSILYFVLKQK